MASLISLLDGLGDDKTKVELFKALNPSVKTEIFQRLIELPHTNAAEKHITMVLKATESDGSGMALFKSIPPAKLLEIVFAFGVRLLHVINNDMRVYLLQELIQQRASSERDQKIILLCGHMGRDATKSLTAESAALVFTILLKSQNREVPEGPGIAIATRGELTPTPRQQTPSQSTTSTDSDYDDEPDSHTLSFDHDESEDNRTSLDPRQSAQVLLDPDSLVHSDDTGTAGEQDLLGDLFGSGESDDDNDNQITPLCLTSPQFDREWERSSAPKTPEHTLSHRAIESSDELVPNDGNSSDSSSSSSTSGSRRGKSKTNIKITEESLCYRMGFTEIKDHSAYRFMLRGAKRFCTMIDFNISWEANDPEALESEIDRLHTWWEREFKFPRDLTAECLKVCCGWPDDLVPGDRVRPEAHRDSRQYSMLLRKLIPDSLQYRMGFTSEGQLHRTAYLRRRQKIKDMVPGVNWLVSYSHQHETIRQTALDRVYQLWGPEYGYSRELYKEVLKTLCANGSSVAGRVTRAEHRRANPNTPLKRGRKPCSFTSESPISPDPATPLNVLNLPRMKSTPKQSLSALLSENNDPSLINRIMRKSNSSNLPSVYTGNRTRLDYMDRPAPPALSVRPYMSQNPSQAAGQASRPARPVVRKAPSEPSKQLPTQTSSQATIMRSARQHSTQPPSQRHTQTNRSSGTSTLQKRKLYSKELTQIPDPESGNDSDMPPRTSKRRRGPADITTKVVQIQEKRRLDLARKVLSAKKRKSTAAAKSRRKLSKGNEKDTAGDNSESEADIPIPQPITTQTTAVSQQSTQARPRRGRGRPPGRKPITDVPVKNTGKPQLGSIPSTEPADPPRRGPGRPRKKPVVLVDERNEEQGISSTKEREETSTNLSPAPPDDIGGVADKPNPPKQRRRSTRFKA